MLKGDDLDFHKANVDDVIDDLDQDFTGNSKAKIVSGVLKKWRKDLDTEYGVREPTGVVKEVDAPIESTDM